MQRSVCNPERVLGGGARCSPRGSMERYVSVHGVNPQSIYSRGAQGMGIYIYMHVWLWLAIKLTVLYYLDRRGRGC